METAVIGQGTTVGSQQHGGYRPFILALTLMALLGSLVLATGIGPVRIPPGDVAAILLNHTGLFHFSAVWAATSDTIVWQFRLPMVVESALVGAALALAGTLFQGLLRNPLADPFLLGISSGASVGATFAYLLPAGVLAASFASVPIFAFCGSLVAIFLVYWLARVGQRTPVVTLILAGVAISALLGAVQTIIVTQNATVAQRLGSLYLWLAGNILFYQWQFIGVVALLVAIGIVLGWSLAPVLDAFALGEDGAAYLGIRVERMKIITIAVAALLVAAAVTLSGLVGFVGLFIPHICRLLIGPRHRLLLPLATALGSVFVIWANVFATSFIAIVSQQQSAASLPLGVVTALVGGPFFLWLLRRSTVTMMS